MNIAEPFERQAHITPDAPAWRVGPHVFTYAQLRDDVLRAAAALRAAGVEAGRHVLLTAQSQPVHIVMTLACARIGAVSVAWPGSTNPDHLAETVDELKVDVLVHDHPADLEGLGSVRQLRALQLLDRSGPLDQQPRAHLEPDELWRVAFSSGTTGRPKPISFPIGGQILKLSTQQLMYGVEPNAKIVLGAAPHMSVGTNAWLRTLYGGACIVVLNQWTAEEVLDLIRAGEATHINTTPSMAIGLARLARDGEPLQNRLKLLVASGGRIAPEVLRGLRERVADDVIVAYGSSEAGGIAGHDAETQASHPLSVGRLYHWVEAQALGEDGEPLPAGQVGVLRFRTPFAFSGYLGNAAADQRLDNGWFRSNDVGAITDDGVVYLAGRADDVINFMGNKIDPEQLEALIAQDPVVTECALVCVDTSEGTQQLAAAVVATGELDMQKLKARWEGHFGEHAPDLTVIPATAIPRNQGGKIVRPVITEQVRRHLLAK